MNPDLPLAFWGVSLLLIAVPGPDWAFVLGCSGRCGAVLAPAAGLVTGYALLTVAVAGGVGALVARTPVLLSVLTLGGAAYLVRLGVAFLSGGGVLHLDEPGTRRGSPVLRGVVVSGLNPKGLLTFVAVLPQFTDPRGAWPMPGQLAALGSVFVATCGMFYCALGLTARSVLTTRPRAMRAVSRLAGVSLLVLGLALVVERLSVGGASVVG